MKIFRWKYIVPRVGLLLVVGLVLRFGLDPALRWALLQGGAAATGAQVEIAQVHSALWGGQLSLHELAIANPRAPLRNLLEASDAQLQLDVQALLQGRLVVESGKLSGLQFDTDRETSGALAREIPEESGPSALDPLLAAASSRGLTWLEQLGDRLTTDISQQLQSPRLAKELQESWPRRYAQLEQQIRDIHQQGEKLQRDFRALQSNPLGGLDQLPHLQQRVAQLQQEIQSMQRQLDQFPAEAKSEKQAVQTALAQDEAFLRSQLSIAQLDGTGLSQTLLGEPIAAGLSTALEWIQWARMPSHAAAEPRQRGTTVVFTPPQPAYQIRHVQLEGFAQVGGQPLPLVGQLTGVSSAPQLLAEPTRLELHSSAALDLTVQVELDRRDQVPRDLLHISCPRLPIPAQTWGNPAQLAITLGEGSAHFQVDLALQGEHLSGEISFAQKTLRLSSQLAASQPDAFGQALDEALAGIQQLEATVALAGTLQKPRFQIDSEIGEELAAVCNTALANWARERVDKLLAENRQQVDAQLEQLTKLHQQTEQKLVAQLGAGQELLGQLAAFSGRPGLPAGIPQFGKKFGLDNLRK